MWEGLRPKLTSGGGRLLILPSPAGIGRIAPGVLDVANPLACHSVRSWKRIVTAAWSSLKSTFGIFPVAFNGDAFANFALDVDASDDLSLTAFGETSFEGTAEDADSTPAAAAAAVGLVTTDVDFDEVCVLVPDAGDKDLLFLGGDDVRPLYMAGVNSGTFCFFITLKRPKPPLPPKSGLRCFSFLVGDDFLFTGDVGETWEKLG